MTFIWPMSICVPNFRQTSPMVTAICCKNTNPRSRQPPSWILPKVGYWATVTLYMANICQCTKFDKNIFIYDWDMANRPKIENSIWRPLPCWIVPKWYIGLHYPLYGQYLSVYQIWRKYLNLRSRYGKNSKFQEWPPPSWIYKKCKFWRQWPLCDEYLSANQIWCKSAQ